MSRTRRAEAGRLSSSLRAEWKHRESTHTCWFNTNTQRPVSHCPSRMLSWSSGSGRTIRPGLSRVKVKHFHPCRQSEVVLYHPPCHVSVNTSWTHLKTCELFTGHNNILQVGNKTKTKKNAGAAGLELQYFYHLIPHLCYTFPPSDVIPSSCQSAVEHNRCCSDLPSLRSLPKFSAAAVSIPHLSRFIF